MPLILSGNVFTVLCRKFSTRPPTPFLQNIASRRAQASRSILIKARDKSHVEEHMQNRFGLIDFAYEFKNAKETWVLVEFRSKDELKKLTDASKLHTCDSLDNERLWTQSSICLLNDHIQTETHIRKKYTPIEEKKAKDQKALTKMTEFEEIVSHYELPEHDIRLRFMLAYEIERILSAFFPSGLVLPFGSTVSGIGRRGGDLDLVIVADKSEIFPMNKFEGKDSCLKFLNKQGSNTNRFQTQRIMENLADVIQLFLGGVSQVIRILNARVPILRFEFNSFLVCDLSMTNSTGVHMSEIIYIMGLLDDRFKVMTFALRAWAASRNITNPNPGRQPTNFMIVMLLINFLQYKKILPTFDVLFNNSRPSDTRVTADGIDCSFLRDPEKVHKHFTPKNKNVLMLDLLFDFFDFYSSFDFNSKGISLFTSAGVWGKPDNSAMYIQNPLERHMNVAKNVSRDETIKFKQECCSALWRMETIGSDGNALQVILGSSLRNVSKSQGKVTQYTSGSRILAKEVMKD